LTEIVLPHEHPRTCCSCLTRDPIEFHRVEDDGERLRASAFLQMHVPLGALFCFGPVAPCWSRKYNRPLWAASELCQGQCNEVVLVHRWRLSRAGGHAVSTVDVARCRSAAVFLGTKCSQRRVPPTIFPLSATVARTSARSIVMKIHSVVPSARARANHGRVRAHP
jgi:hypothetical protein